MMSATLTCAGVGWGLQRIGVRKGAALRICVPVIVSTVKTAAGRIGKEDICCLDVEDQRRASCFQYNIAAATKAMTKPAKAACPWSGFLASLLEEVSAGAASLVASANSAADVTAVKDCVLPPLPDS